MSTYALIPPYGSRERVWFLEGAARERALMVEGMTPGGRTLFDYVHAAAQSGEHKDNTIDRAARVFTADWTLWERIRLAWRIVAKR